MKRNQNLDLLRGISILLVLCTHHYAIRPLYHAGWIGVDLFFVISGFLVSGLLFNEYLRFKKISAFRFLARRGFKIYPQFYVLIGITILINIFFPFPDYTRQVDYFFGVNLKNTLAELFFVQNYLGGIWINTWSLAVEEHFYLLILVLVMVTIKTGLIENHKFWVSVFVIIILLSLAGRIVMFTQFDFSFLTHLFPTHLRFDSLFAGVMISWFFHFKSDKLIDFTTKNRRLLIAGCFIPLVSFFVPLNSALMGTIGLSLIWISFSCLLLLVLQVSSHSQGFMLKILSKIGYYSYSIYIWHLFFKHYSFIVFKRFIPDSGNSVYFLIYLAITISGGIFMAIIIEQPFLKLRDKLFASRAKAL